MGVCINNDQAWEFKIYSAIKITISFHIKNTDIIYGIHTWKETFDKNLRLIKNKDSLQTRNRMSPQSG